MAEFPNPLNLVPGRNGAPSDDASAEAAGAAVPTRGAVVRSRVGSPNVLVSLPFSQIEIHETDPGIGDDVVELATLFSELASAVAAVLGDDHADLRDTVDALRARAEELRTRIEDVQRAQ